ncbi:MULTISPECIES: hypothetical protein [Methylosinus]|uniref:Uncharacterized protein n=1 Tax=Methylosinus trichosporium (strain ATCC 35070 / NCIMB 11131 / UNIQEM 75 / OB3b) TaxID=595536 RepID=A0A2D2D447_METT3|nr:MULTISPECIES: hypothetical protein [Methylosinus]ATQ69757.1 hypothetical protein CQW49_19110 [Methylosinus trichosporium OB3b]OBS52444.1 hypothetical protein A8B73_11350 [Methylosinus sp. 3S-1]
MNIDRVKPIADAVLYEGYILYPYRPSATKNRTRWMFGELHPRSAQRAGGEASLMRAELLIEAEAGAEVEMALRFLQNRWREIGEIAAPVADVEAIAFYRPTDSLVIDGEKFLSFEEAIERRVDIEAARLDDLCRKAQRRRFSFAASREIEPIRAHGEIVAVIARSSEAVEGEVVLSATRLDDALFRLRVEIENLSPLMDADAREDSRARAFLSTHLIFEARGGAFVSLIEPPERHRAAARGCAGEGLWPTLVGEPGRRDRMLASPIILSDYPQVAPESRNAFFDGAEIDELLTLRVRTLSADEKREMAAADPRTRDILQRCETMTRDDLGALHGAFRPLEEGDEAPFAVGARVRIAPKAGGDIMDIALAGKVAVVEAVERDFEGRAHVAVTLVEDPGADLGAAGFPGHRFFFSPQELQPLDGGAS